MHSLVFEQEFFFPFYYSRTFLSSCFSLTLKCIYVTRSSGTVTTRLSKPKTIVKFFFYICIFNTHGAGNQRT